MPLHPARAALLCPQKHTISVIRANSERTINSNLLKAPYIHLSSAQCRLTAIHALPVACPKRHLKDFYTLPIRTLHRLALIPSTLSLKYRVQWNVSFKPTFFLRLLTSIQAYQKSNVMPALHFGPRMGPMQNFVNSTSQMTSGFYHDSTLQHPPALPTLWNDPRVTYTPGHYTPRNLREDHLLQSNEYHRRRVEDVIKYSARFQWFHFRNVQEDDDLMYCFTPGPHFRLIDAWVEIFLSTPNCYLMIALEEVRVAFFEQTARVPNPVHMHRRPTVASTGHSLKRKAAIAEDGLQIEWKYGIDDNVEEPPTESRKRFRNDDTAPRIEQFLSSRSSSDLGRVLETVVSDTTTQHPTASQAAKPHAPVASTTTVVAAPAVAAASQVQPTVPVTVTPATVAVQAPLADPIAAMMARFPTRNTVNVSGRGCKGVAMSRGQIRAHLEIEGRTLATLPSSANSDDRHEMRGVAPPRTVDPTLINCVTTAQEMLTVRTSLLV